MKTQLTLLFFMLLLFGPSVNAQKVDLSLQFNPKTKEYIVYAKSDFTKEEFLMSAKSQITVLIPAGFEDKQLITKSLTDINWLDSPPICAPEVNTNVDFHTFVAQGGALHFKTNKPCPLFSFSLPLNYDHKAIRLLVHRLDPEQIIVNGSTKKLNHFIANEISLTDFYRSNYGILKDFSGHLKDWRGYPIEGVQITLGDKKIASLYDGRMELSNVLIDDRATFHFEKDIPAKTGVSTADLIRLQRHLNGEKLFDHPFQWIAADLDNSGTVTFKDYDLLKELINGTPILAGWRFLPAHWLKDPKLYQQPIPNTISVFAGGRVLKNNFLGIKLGDVDGSFTVQPNVPTNIFRSPKTLTINVLNVELTAQENYVIPFTTTDFDGLTAYQATFKIENATITQLNNTFNKLPGLVIKQIPGNLIVANWINDRSGKRIQVNHKEGNTTHQSASDILLLEIIPHKDGLLSDFLTIQDDPMPTEAYDDLGQKMALQMFFKKAPEEIGQMALYQNTPNPFKESTQINYFLPKDCSVKLHLTNEAGQLIKTFKENGKKGFNTFNISGQEVPKGVIYFNIETEFGKMTKKMLHLN